jgi:ABC-type transport system involved in multi-copper enzyme maturation permease subunit
MTWLLWKEYRQNRLIVWVALFLLLVPYSLAIFAAWLPHPRNGAWRDFFIMAFITGTIYGLALSQFAMAMIGGSLIAGERANRSSEFQSYLPILPSKILVAKVLMAIAMSVGIWLPMGLTLLAVVVFRPHSPVLQGNIIELICRGLGYIAITGLTFFCVAWFFSAFLKSSILATCAGLLTPLCIVVGVYCYSYGSPPSKVPVWLELWYAPTCLTLSLIGFGLGVWIYLRRREP